MTKTYEINQNNQTILSITVEQPAGKNYSNMQWDSKTGLVTAVIDGKRKPIPYSGNSIGTIQPEDFTATNMTGISFRYWYY